MTEEERMFKMLALITDLENINFVFKNTVNELNAEMLAFYHAKKELEEAQEEAQKKDLEEAQEKTEKKTQKQTQKKTQKKAQEGTEKETQEEAQAGGA